MMLKSDKILAGMHDLHPKIIDLSLDRLLSLLEKLGNPQDHLPPVIHIAGTNGKGSTTAYIKTILQAHGKRVHAYTSPHLVNFHERINLATGKGKSADISEDFLVETLEEVVRVNDGAPITFFEMTTAAGFLAFSRTPADYLILEVGLGGRFDTTNVLAQVALSVITPISIDHVQFLGDKLTGIAFEKAGIIKQNCPVIIAPQVVDAFDVVEKVAAEHNAAVTAYGVDFQAYEERGRLIYQHLTGLRDLPLPALQGAHQIQNAAVAIAASEFILSDELDEAKLSDALINVKWPARFEHLQSPAIAALTTDNAEIWLDGGHNAAGGIALAQLLTKIHNAAPKPLYMLIGMMNSKQADEFLLPFVALNPKAICLNIENEPNSFDADELQKMAQEVGITATTAPHFTDALAQIKAETNPDTPIRILICGSLYQAGNILRFIQQKSR